MRNKNKLKRINIFRSLNVVKKNNFLKKKLFKGSIVYVSYYGYGWTKHNFYGVCTSIYKTKNFQAKINLFNIKQNINFKINLNQNLLINLIIKN